MFQRELCKHPSIQTVAYSPHTYLETHHWLKAAVILDMPARLFAGGKFYANYGSKENARTYLIDCVKGNVPDFEVPDNDKQLIFAAWDAMCETFAQPVFFEKSPQILAHWASLSMLLEWIQQSSFRVKVIGLTRNPLAVQYSAYQLFHTDPNLRQFDWLENQHNLLAFKSLLPESSFYATRYEDLIANPKAAFTKIYHFIGLEKDSFTESETHAQSLNKWRDDPYFNFQLDESVRQMALQFGYKSEELTNPVKPKPPLSYRLRRWRKKHSARLIGMLRHRILKPLQLRKKT